jgi:hypothetical protein
MNCHICGRLLNQPDDPLTQDCGGDCWGCIGEIEAAAGFEPSVEQVRQERAAGLRANLIEPCRTASPNGC